MSRYIVPTMLVIVGLSGCLATQTKTGLKRPDFSEAAPVKTDVAPVKTAYVPQVGPGVICVVPPPISSRTVVKPEGSKPDLTTPPEPKKGAKKIGEFPEYQNEDDGTF